MVLPVLFAFIEIRQVFRTGFGNTLIERLESGNMEASDEAILVSK